MTKKSTTPAAVVDYDAYWDTKKSVGDLQVQLQRGKPVQIQINSAGEFTAVLTLLQREKTVFLVNGRTLVTAP
ncbi:MAG: hypothetical protein AAFP90_04200 [Planctomycetota bacterium]